MTALTIAVQGAIERSPATVRELARRVGVAHTTLTRLGEGHEVAPDVAGRLAQVLTDWARDGLHDAERIRRGLRSPSAIIGLQR